MEIFKAIRLFAMTFFYYLKSLGIAEPAVRQLKQSWARECLRQLGYQFHEIGGRPEADHGLILVGNHVSFLDIMVLMAVSPQITFVAKKEVRRWPVIGVAAARVGTIFVDRSPSADRRKDRLEMAKQIRDKAAFLTVFPSGTTSLVENKNWKKGVFEISQEYNVPVKAFKIKYEPLRVSAYIDEDDLITQMLQMFRTKNKTVTLTWLPVFKIDDPQRNAEEIRNLVELS